ncbi:MAG TPA: class I SAM-dependent methyltransferase [Novosphingobium sp.]|nr:class I SAM-dependent methyltransferase [Novosphingobium sp.]
MSELLIHSMNEFADVILDTLSAANARSIVEIGAEFGGMTQRLANYCAQIQGDLTTIDPSPKPEFLEWLAGHSHVRHLPLPSLEAMGELAQVDAWLIDGDHNYYTVFHEMQAADQLAQQSGRPLLALLHDVGWPCARRDMYYAPDRIPPAWRQPNDHNVGVYLGNPGSFAHRGFRGGGHFAWALEAGGPRNGVLTAVEDFIAFAEAEGRQMAYAHIPAVFGLGVVFDISAPWANAVAALLAPYHDNALIARLEENRLRNYLTVLDMQDSMQRMARGFA